MSTQPTIQLVDYAGQDYLAPSVTIDHDMNTGTYRAVCTICGAEETSAEPIGDAWARDHWPVHRSETAS